MDLNLIPKVPAKTRRPDLWTRDGRALVSIVDARSDLHAAVRRSLDLIGGLHRLIRPGDTVLLKPNLVQALPPPVSTDLGFLAAVVDLLRAAGAGRIIVGESTGRSFGMTMRQVFTALSYDEFAGRMGLDLVCFDEGEWVNVQLGGEHWASCLMPRVAYEADKLVYLPTLKSHSLARFTGALKLAVGFTQVARREHLHAGPIEEKAAELNLAWQPDLCIMDARKVFVNEGPCRGEVGEPGLVLAGGDQIAMDVEGVGILQSFGRNPLLEGRDPWALPMIHHAVKLGLGSRSADDYLVLRA